MYAITGATGRVGGTVARELLASGHEVRVVVRDAAKASAWAALGAEVATADFLDTAGLERAFRGVDGVLVMVPANFAPSPGFGETSAIVASLSTALAAAAPSKVVCLSSIGAQHARGLGLITALHIVETGLGGLGLPVAFLRPGWFMENAAWDVASAQKEGEIASFLQPLDRPVPMVATADVGRVAAETLLEAWAGRRIIEVEGPSPVSPNDMAWSFGRMLDRPVAATAVPREQWGTLFEAQGTRWPAPRIEMLDGFNSGWIAFQGEGTEHRVGRVSFDDIVRDLVARGTP
jgi:NAD(P)H dehydrogenase (quinone)